MVFRALPIAFLALALVAAASAEARERSAVTGGYRLMGWPDFMLGSSLADSQPIYGHGFVAGYDYRTGSGFWTFGVGLLPLATPDGYWRAEDTPADQGAFAEFELTYLSIFAARSWQFDIGGGFYALLTGGLGVAFVIGDIYVTELIPGCEGDITACGHWRDVTRKPVAMDSRVLPALEASASLGYSITDTTNVLLDAGILNLPFVGLSVQQRL